MMSFMAVVHLFFGWFGTGFGIAVLCFLGYLFAPKIPFITDGLRGFLLHAAVAIAIATFVYGYAFGDGYKYAINQIAAKNQEALNNVQDALKDVKACRASGGVWNTSSGLCEHS